MLDDRDVRFDLFALGLLALTIFLGLSLLTYSPADSLGEPIFPLNLVYQPHQVEYPINDVIHNACGHAGATCADVMLRTFGVAAYFVVLCVAIVDFMMLMRRPIDGAGARLFGWLLALVGGVTLVQMFLPAINVGPAVGPGGIIGAMGRSFLESHFATAGSLILLASLIIGGIMLCTDYVLLHIALVVGATLLNFMPRIGAGIAESFSGLRPSWWGRTARASRLTAEDEYEYEQEEELKEEPIYARKRKPVFNDLSSVPEIEDEEEYEEEEVEDELAEEEDEYEYEYDDEEESEEEQPVNAVAAVAASAGAAATGAKLLQSKSPGSERAEVIAKLEEASRKHDPQDYELPSNSLLHTPESYDVTELTKEVQRKARLLEKTFEDFKLDVKVVDIETGPVIAQYEVALKRGLRLSKITGLADDLAIALRVPSVRIVAPLPGKNTVGIEVPNDERQMVRMQEVMDETNGHVRKMALPIFLGKDASGNPLAVDLAKMPHLLIAGRTGTGKSVCLNSIISSMLMTKTPDDVRMLMIDPKMVELSGYARLPHLMHPVVTDMRKAEAILAWACDKMDERYRLLARAGVRHLSSYNQLGEDELMSRLKPESEDDKKLIPRHLPYIVIIADEMADLMMTAGKEVEAHIIRLASKSRAVGIHLILATQRPTANVITGLIKSNLPARIAFQVASGLDSRVVLDENGADKLLGYGDMLFLSPGTSTLLRGQGTFTSDDEIDRIVDYCSSKGEQKFVRELVQLKVAEKDEEGTPVQLKKRDELYEQAVEVVVREGRGSVSLLQRNLQIGYGRAARLIDFMAEDGIVGSYNGSQAREVLMTHADWQATKASEGDTTVVVESETLKPKMAKVVAIPTSPEEELEDELEEDEEWEEEELEDDEEYEDEEAELEDDEEYEEEEPDEEEEAYEEDEVEAELEEDEEWEDVEEELNGEEYEQEDFDSVAFQKAVAEKTKGVDLKEAAAEYSEEIAEAKKGLVPKIKGKSSKPRRRTDKSQPDSDKLNPHARNTKKKINKVHRSHAE